MSRVYNFSARSGCIAGRSTERSSRGNDGLSGMRYVRYGNEPSEVLDISRILLMKQSRI